MKIGEALPELVGDIEGALIRLGRGKVADQLRGLDLSGWNFDEFAQSTYLQLTTERNPGGVEETISLYDDIGVSVELDSSGQVIGMEVFGYEQSLSRLGPSPI